MTGPRVPVEERFRQKVEELESGCWRWTAYCMKNGYGLFRMKHGHELAHRMSYRLFKGEIPEGLDVMHGCDNPWCVNPKHLSVGTRKQNMQDAASKGRSAKGETHGRRKLSELEAIYVKFLPFPQEETAEMFGITQGQVSQIRSGKAWSHLHERNYHR